MSSNNKYFDEVSAFNVLGNLMNNPSLLDEKDKYNFMVEDFYGQFYGIIFAAINNLFADGSNSITVLDIENYLSARPGLYNVYTKNQGTNYLVKALENSNRATFDYYFNRLRKMTILREFNKIGANVNKFYDPDNILDITLKQKQEDWLMNSSVAEVIDALTKDMEELKDKYLIQSDYETDQAADGLMSLIESFKEAPDVGVPLYGRYINTILRGARLKKFYLRSAPTGVGKSRTMAADACFIGCSEIYDLEKCRWVSTGVAEPVSLFTTELELSEVQTMMVAFLSGVEEDTILNYSYVGDELERVKYAIKLLEQSQIHITQLPDFSLSDIEMNLKKHIREFGTKYLFFDYIHSSLKILEEITKKTGGMKLREDQILFMMSIRMKDLANEYGVFIMSGTQVNGAWQDADTPDQNLLRGAKAIADKIDAGIIIMPATPEDVEALQPILMKLGMAAPTHYLSIYKNRRGKFKSVRLWCHGKLGICRLDPCFLTDHNHNFIPIDNLVIETEEEEKFKPTNFDDHVVSEAYEMVF